MTTRAVPSVTTAKLGRVATLGYHQPQAWQLVTGMVTEQGWYLVDIRSSRRSYLEEWSGSSLRRHFQQSYHAVPELGNLHDLQPDQPVQLADPATGLTTVTTWLEAGIDCLLLCACPDWRHCHRRLVATLLRQTYPTLEVSHLVPDAFAVDLLPWCCETVALLQRYGLLRPLPHAPEEQPVLLRTASSTASAHDERDPWHGQQPAQQGAWQQPCGEKEGINVCELPAAAPFGPSSVCSPASRAGEHTSVKKGRPHATDALGEESTPPTTNKEKCPTTLRTSVFNHRHQ